MSALIIGSGSDISRDMLEPEKLNIEYVICADGGLEKVENLQLIPNSIIGDLDSVDDIVLKKYLDMNIELKKYSAEKNYTDMELAIEYAIEKGFNDIILIGATGLRLDHTVANIMLIERYYKKGIHIKVIDNNNCIQIVTNNMEINNKRNYFVSIVPITDSIEGISLMGFKYPLDSVDVKRGSTLCISNQITSEKGNILLDKGAALVFISKD
nr:thiamine diphosphokinase [Sedimentibacter sp.]